MSDDLVLRFAVSAHAERAAPLHYPNTGTAADLQDLIEMGALHERCVVLLIADESERAAAELIADKIANDVAVRVDLLPKPAPEAEPEPDSLSTAEVEHEIDRLARLTAIEYERERKPAAKRLGMRPFVLDAFVKRARPRGSDDGLPGRPIPSMNRRRGQRRSTVPICSTTCARTLCAT